MSSTSETGARARTGMDSEAQPADASETLSSELRWASLAAGAALVAIGAGGVFFPRKASEAYGVPLSAGEGAAYLQATAVRDISLGGTLLAFALLRDRRALGLSFLLGSLIAVGDGTVALRNSPYPRRVLPLHWGGAAAFWGLAYSLLRAR